MLINNVLDHQKLLSKIEKAGFSGREYDWLACLHGLISTSNYSINCFDLLAIALRQPQFFRQKPETLNANVERSAALFGLTKAQFIGVALKQPQLFYQKPETLNANVEGSAALLELTKAQFIGVALKQPPLFYQRPDTLNANVEGSAALLGLTKAQFIAVALRKPPLFYQRPDTLNANVEGSAALLELTKAQFTAAALKRPSLFGQRPETLNANVEGSAALLGLTKAQFTAAALRQPQLFYQRPDTLNANVEGSAALLGLTKAQFTAIALKQPQLFYQRPDTLNAKKPYIMKIAAALGETKDFASLIQKAPGALTNSRNYLRARYILAKLGLMRGAFASVVGCPSAKATTLIIEHYTARIEKTGSGRCALQVMYAHGIIAIHDKGTQRKAPMPPRPKKGQRMHFGGPQFEGRYGLAQRPLNTSRIQRQEKGVSA